MVSTLRLCALALATTLPATAFAAAYDSVPASGELTYDVIRKGEDIGDRSIRFIRKGDDLTVRLTMQVRVKLPIIGVTAYSYDQDSTEIWTGGALTAMTSATDDDGTKHDIKLGATTLTPGSLWDADIVKATEVLNTVDGTTMKVTVKNAGAETVTARGTKVAATRYIVDGDLKRDLWYDADHLLVHVRMTADDGSTVDYVLR